MTDANCPVTFQSFVTTFTDFLTVAIHTILYERSVYPQTSFLSARKYNYAVRQNRHPKVCRWIQDAVTAVEAEILKGTVERVAVVIYSKDNKPLERFMFDLSNFPVVPLGEQATPLERIDEQGGMVPILPIVDLEEQFRATMSRLTNCGSSLAPIAEGCTFTLALECRDEGEPPIAHAQPWIPVQPQLQKTVLTSNEGRDVIRGADVGGVRTTPLRSVAAGDMVFEMWIEEGKSKFEQALSSEGSG
ncbi:hypothetical protein M8818_001111 [Zalaria obscura]|uniref:Uncharacterized protein n=1 Tax=Zalaria obscura TaxID=2024903 RepID=A0ACC3SNR2_9PEZI